MQIIYNKSTTRSDLGTCISPVFQHHDQNCVCPYNENLYYVFINS